MENKLEENEGQQKKDTFYSYDLDIQRIPFVLVDSKIKGKIITCKLSDNSSNGKYR